MQLQLVSTQLAVRREAVKFSPGLPQNRSCGCWRTGNQTVDVYLNASLIVSGFYFPSATHAQWLKEFSVEASIDNRTYLPWGTYVQANHTSAQTVLFALPIRASVFRLNITRYVNHVLNTSGFAIAAQAVVSVQQPFLCGCPVLPDGTCCPYMNMTVKDNRCLWCKDAKNLNVVMETEWCGVCRPGTVDRGNRCVPLAPVSAPAPSTLDLGDVAITTTRVWTIDLVLNHSLPILSLYLTAQPNRPHPCEEDRSPICLSSPLFTNPQYVILFLTSPPRPPHPFLHFDRGRWQLVLTTEELRSWTTCSPDLMCNGSIGVVYGGGFVQVVETQVDFNLVIVPPPFTLITAIPGISAPTAAEVHSFPHALFLRMDGPGLEYDIMFQCAYKNEWAFVNFFAQPMRMIQLPDGVMTDPFCTRFRIKGVSRNGRRVRFAVDRPSTVVRHDVSTQVEYAPVKVNVSFGVDWGATPSAGDSERVMTVLATSPIPAQLARLAVKRDGSAALATTDGLPAYALNMTTACANVTRVREWLVENADIVLDSKGVRSFCNRTCGTASDHQIYWVAAPSDPGLDRRAPVPFYLMAEFILLSIS